MGPGPDTDSDQYQSGSDQGRGDSADDRSVKRISDDVEKKEDEAGDAGDSDGVVRREKCQNEI